MPDFFFGSRRLFLIINTVVATIASASSIAQTTSYPVSISGSDPNGYSNSTPWSVQQTISGLATTTNSDGTLELTTILGDFDSSSETLRILFDGIEVMPATGSIGGQCSSTSGPALTFTIPQATLASMIADGQIIITYELGGNVDYCSEISSGSDMQIGGTLSYDGSNAIGGASPSIGRFLQARGQSLMINQPDVVRFVDGRAATSFNGKASDDQGSLDIKIANIDSAWAEVQANWTDGLIGNENYFLGTVGSHVRLSGNTIVGGMVQFDHAKRSESGIADISGTGWNVGPYFATKIGDQPLYLDGRLLYGQTDNELLLDGESVPSSFDGDRWLATLGLEGKYSINEHFTVLPGIDIRHVRERQKAFDLSNGSGSIAEQSVRQTDAELKLGFEAPFITNNENHTFTGGASAIWSNIDMDMTATPNASMTKDWRGRVEFGYRYMNQNGFTADANIYVDGLGTTKNSYGTNFMFGYSF